uniref:Uncharacterized protein n=1 Tax=Arundo donax TaxID=35708 RepID=A0A0A8ZWA6_ARUDO
MEATLTKTRFCGGIGGGAAQTAPDAEGKGEDSIRGEGEERRVKCARASPRRFAEIATTTQRQIPLRRQ